MSGVEIPAWLAAMGGEGMGAAAAGTGAAAGGAGSSIAPQILSGLAMQQAGPIMAETVTAQPGMAAAVPGIFKDPTHIFPDVSMTGIPGAAAAGPTPPATTAPTPVPPIQPTPAWKEALMASATVQDMAMKAGGRGQNAPSPNFYIPVGTKAPSLGTPIAKGPSPLERFALYLRR